MRKLVMLALLAAAMSMLSCGGAAQVEKNEEVVFFPTCAYPDADGAHWVVPVHGWLFEPETNSLKRKPLLAAFRTVVGVEEHEAKAGAFNDRARAFLVDNKGNRIITIRLGAKNYALGKSGENGHFRGTLRLTLAEAVELTGVKEPAGARATFRAFAGGTDPRVFTGDVFFLGPTGVSVISDIDDTVKVSNVRDRKDLVRNTFAREFVAVAGMPELYRDWEKAGARFHYVTASPWQLYKPIEEFFAAAGIPTGGFHMKDFRWLDSSFLNLFASPEKTKREAIEPILKTFGDRKFVLVGDSGELDPEIYGALAREHPKQIALILIRLVPGPSAGNVAGEAADAPRFRKAFEDVPREKWQVFKDPAEIREKVPGLMK